MMADITPHLPLIWAGLIGTAVLLYVVLDGFDLGVGILFPTTRDEAERDQMMNSVAPFWDGNETWLVLGSGGLWVAFPKAYAAIMPALYFPVILLLLALIFRGVAFEFRWVAKPHHRLWDIAFSGGSFLAAFAQGLIIGGMVEGITIKDGAFAGGAFDWLTGFSLMCGFGMVAGYGLLGAGWLIYRTEGEIEQRVRRQARILLLVMLAFIGIVSIWTPAMSPRIAARWFVWPNMALLSPLPLFTLLSAWWAWRSTRGEGRLGAYLGSAGLFILSFLGLCVSNYPYLVPPHMTIWDTAAAPESQAFMLVGTVVLLPLVLAYTAFVFWTFRGRVGEGYH